MKLEMLLVEGQLWTCMRFSDCHTLRRKKSKIFEWWEVQPKVFVNFLCQFELWLQSMYMRALAINSGCCSFGAASTTFFTNAFNPRVCPSICEAFNGRTLR